MRLAERATDAESMAKDLALARTETQDHHALFAMASIQTSRLAPRTWHDRTKVLPLSQATNVTGAATE